MINLKGEILTELGFTLHHRCDIINYEGPFCSLFQDEDDNYYFFDLVDDDSNNNRWMVYGTTLEQLVNFFDKKISLLDIVKSNSEFYFLDIRDYRENNNLLYASVRLEKITKVKYCDLPSQYLYDDNNYFFDKEQSEILIIEKIKLDIYKKIRTEKLKKLK